MNKNKNNGFLPPHEIRLNAISLLWNRLKEYKGEHIYDTQEKLLYDTKTVYSELDIFPEMFDVCTKLQKLEYQSAASPEYRHELIDIMMEAMEVLQVSQN